MKLDEITKEYEIQVVQGETNIEVTGVEQDSRKIKNGNMFIAIDGFTVDGHNYINEAIKNGANCIVIEKNVVLDNRDITIIKVEDTELALAKFSSIYYDEPSKKLNLIGVTGTNGKTSITYLIRSIFDAQREKSGLIGTMGTVIDGKLMENKNTTPDSLTIQRYLKSMVDTDTKYCAMEVSSHALALDRVEYMDFQLAVFSNLTEDHLDYHENMESYYKSKLRLFNKSKKYNIINIDDGYGKRILEEVDNTVPIMTYGIEEKAEVYATDINLNNKGVAFNLNSKKGSIPINLNLLGKFSVYNALAASACGIAYGLDLETIKVGLESVTGIKGRFEMIPLEEDYTVIIDFAHTPDGLEKVLTTIDQFAEGRKIVLFGAGGNRDKRKRPIMGETVAKHADLCIVTSDNPRYEDPDKIIEDVLVGVNKVNGNYIAIRDRREAIEYALKNARPKDIILLAGKGHETYTIIKDKVIPFDEKEIVLEILENM